MGVDFSRFLEIFFRHMTVMGVYIHESVVWLFVLNGGMIRWNRHL